MRIRGSLSLSGPVSTDQEIQTAVQPGEATTLSELLTLNWARNREKRGKNKNEFSSDTRFFLLYQELV